MTYPKFMAIYSVMYITLVPGRDPRMGGCSRTGNGYRWCSSNVGGGAFISEWVNHQTLATKLLAIQKREKKTLQDDDDDDDDDDGDADGRY